MLIAGLLLLLQQISRELSQSYNVEDLEDVRVIRSRQSSARPTLSIHKRVAIFC